MAKQRPNRTPCQCAGGCKSRPATRYALAGAVAVTTALLTLSNAPAFGPPGHQGVIENAWRILYANDPARCATKWPSGWDEWRLQTSEYPDATVVYTSIDDQLAPLIALADELARQGAPPQLPAGLRALAETLALPDSLNSADHYFDPTNPTAVAGPWTFNGVVDRLKEQNPDWSAEIELLRGWITALYDTLYNLSPGLVRDFDACYRGGSGYWPIAGADGTGYNALTSILFLLNGRGTNDPSDPCGGAPHKGFIQLARQARPGDPEDRAFRDALICLGATIHYVADLFSAGHTAWDSWWQLEGLGYAHTHGDFDQQGDLYFIDLTSIQGIKPQVILEYRGGRARCTVVSGKGLGSTDHPYPDGFASMDLPAALIQAATTSHDQWLRRDEAPPPSDEHYLHIVGGSVSVAAGVIDWAFSAAATSADQVYARDATNFFGMANGQASVSQSPASVAPAEFKDRTCSLGGIDCDDYYPVHGNSYRYARISILKGPPASAGLLVNAQAWPVNHTKPIQGQVVLSDGAPAIEIPLGTELSPPPDTLLLRVYASEADSVSYRVLFTNESLPPTPTPTGGMTWLVLLAIMMIGFSFLLRPVLGRLSNGLVLIALGMVGIAWMCDTWSLSRGGLWGLLIGLIIIALLIRGGLRQLFGSPSR
ncbi:MAG: hypothetical protein KA354_17195 [Phycisphaerae bacterium]|nr:hypothetical protein [Phycisphaerae bacterium]